MAIDEAVFRESQRLSSSTPVLRFFGWDPPAVSIGYFQDFEKEINVAACAAAGIDVVRRITGGRAVFHQLEVTYSIIGREDDPLFPEGILGRYLAFSQCIARGLERFGLCAELEASSRSGAEGDLKAFCFSVPSQYELLVRGRKICGSAQARANGSFLQHGSLLIDFDPLLSWRLMSPAEQSPLGGYQKKLENSVTCVNWEFKEGADVDEVSCAIQGAFEDAFGVRLIAGELTDEEIILKNRLIRNKYQRDSWNRRREAGCELASDLY